MNNFTTYSTSTIKPLTLADIEKSIEKIKPMTDELVIKIEVCQKHYNSMRKQLPEGSINGIWGIPVFVVPYLKKAKVYKKNGTVTKIRMTKFTPLSTTEEERSV